MAKTNYLIKAMFKIPRWLKWLSIQFQNNFKRMILKQIKNRIEHSFEMKLLPFFPFSAISLHSNETKNGNFYNLVFASTSNERDSLWKRWKKNMLMYMFNGYESTRCWRIVYEIDLCVQNKMFPLYPRAVNIFSWSIFVYRPTNTLMKVNPFLLLRELKMSI